MVIATGFFDGVHLGHRFLLDALVSEARRRGEESMVVTFWPHPRNVLQNGARELRLLTSMDEKRSLISQTGVDHIEVIEFTREFSHLTASEYIKDVLVRDFGATCVVLGYDNRLGSDMMEAGEVVPIAHECGVDVRLVPPCPPVGGKVISSTRIRGLLASGAVEEASSLLGYDYGLFGVVVSGNRIGRTIGFPTANLELYEPLKVVPEDGVYLVEATTLGKRYDGMCNIGVRPTVGNSNAKTIETNIFGFDENIYGLDLRLTFRRRIRSEVKFSGLAQLARQLSSDRHRCLTELKYFD
mgnify:FL=1